MKIEFDDNYFMSKAIDEAKIALSKGEVPIGAVIVADNKIIARAHNMVEALNDVTAHAEILAITSASNYIGGKYLENCSIYVTLEPCHMCAKAIVDARIKFLIFATKEPKTGSICSIDNFLDNEALNRKVSYKFGLLEEESSNLLKNFFISKR